MGHSPIVADPLFLLHQYGLPPKLPMEFLQIVVICVDTSLLKQGLLKVEFRKKKRLYLLHVIMNLLITRFLVDCNRIKTLVLCTQGTTLDWKRCNKGIPYTSDIPSAVRFHQNLTGRGYRALVYRYSPMLPLPFLIHFQVLY